LPFLEATTEPFGVVRELTTDAVWEVWEVSYSILMGSCLFPAVSLPIPKDKADTNIITKDKNNLLHIGGLPKLIVSDIFIPLEVTTVNFYI